MAAAAPVAALASVGFGAGSSIAKGYGEQAAADTRAGKAEFDAQRAERAAEFGRIQANQTDAGLREELQTTLANIDAIRASSNIMPGSPTGEAIKDRESYISDRQRRAKVTSIMAQADEDQRTATYDRSVAAYERSVGRQAVLMGYLGAGSSLTGGFAKGYGGFGRSIGSGGGGPGGG